MTLSPADRVRRRRLRGVAAVMIVIAWGAALAGLVRRDVLRTPAERLAEIALRVNPGNVFYEVARDGRRVGYASSTVDTSEVGDTLWIRDEIATEFRGTGGVDRAIRRSEVNLTRGFALRGFVFDVDSGDALRRVIGRALGDSVITLVTLNDGVVADSQAIRVRGPLMMPAMVPFAMMLSKTPKVGRSASYATFDPARREMRDVSLRILAESLFVVDDSARMNATTGRFVTALKDTVRAWNVSEDGGAAQWLDAQGRAVETSANGARLRRMAYELSFENWRLDALVTDANASGSDVTLAPVDARITIHGAPTKRVVARLIAESLSGFDLKSPRQSVNGNVITVSIDDSAAMSAGYSLPPDARFRTQYREYLQAEPFLQTRVPAMLRQSIAIVKHEREAGAMARLIAQWVTDSIERSTQPGDPDAAQILRTHKADASGHAQIFTALARSLDIPTRLVSGAVRIDGHFYFHTWVEVFLGDWVAVDPTFGQFPADAGHIRLGIGGTERRSALRRNMRSLHIEVVEAR